MQAYLDLLQHILTNGVDKSDRTGTGTRSIFGYQMRFNLQQGFPLVTTKKVHTKSIIYELLWFLKGDTNIKYLKDNGVRIWDEWADEAGNLGPVYGAQWRSWQGVNGNTIDQITTLMDLLHKDPDSRRLIVNAWNVAALPEMKLSPCHALFQFYTTPPDISKGETKRKLSCQLYQRSADVFLGVPFNIASYAMLTHMIAHVCHMDVGDFIHSFGDVHIYSNHVEQVQLQLSRTPLPLPTLKINRQVPSIFDFEFEDFTIENYQSHGVIKAPVAV